MTDFSVITIIDSRFAGNRRFDVVNGQSMKIYKLNLMAAKPKLIVIAGPNGSGKTTVTEQLLAHQWGDECEYINPDNIARDVYGDWNSPESVMNAAKYATERRYSLLKEGRSMVFETVLSSNEKVDFIRKALESSRKSVS